MIQHRSRNPKGETSPWYRTNFPSFELIERQLRSGEVAKVTVKFRDRSQLQFRYFEEDANVPPE